MRVFYQKINKNGTTQKKLSLTSGNNFLLRLQGSYLRKTGFLEIHEYILTRHVTRKYSWHDLTP